MVYLPTWTVEIDQHMSNGWQFSLLNDEQMSNKVGVEHQPATFNWFFLGSMYVNLCLFKVMLYFVTW